MATAGTDSPGTAAPEHVDVVVVGAGLSGIGAACTLQQRCPRRSVAVLEARGDLGGTWDLFRYPGVRSDSDMYSLGYRFRPWPGPKAIADGASILDYVRATAREYGVEQRIRYRHRVVGASWSSEQSLWTLEVAHTGPGESDGKDGVAHAPTFSMTCSFLLINTGYYRYRAGYTPSFDGAEHFTGRLVHPQHWPTHLDVDGRRVVVIGSGATAVTLVPALVRAGAQVTMLQRSPSYVLSLASSDPLARVAARVLPAGAAARLTRAKNVALVLSTHTLARRLPRRTAALLRRGVARQLPPGYDVATHFTPRYRPWDQRLCVVPDGDLFRAIRSGDAEVVTDGIDRFTTAGLRLTSGRELPADVVVTATGLDVLAFGGLRVDLDGTPVDLADRVAYKGVMLSGVPNLIFTIGYAHASWTLKADLTAVFACRLLNHLNRHRHLAATPAAPPPARPTVPFVDLTSGYLRRSTAAMPPKGVDGPWRSRDYWGDLVTLGHAPLDDGSLVFTPAQT